jgi:transposase-like protein
MEADILQPQFTDEDAARAFLEAQRWPNGPECPHCGVIGDSYRLEAKTDSKTPVRKGVWKCGSCREQFTVTVGTIFEDSHIKLQKWLLAIHLLCASKKGMSAHQLHRMLGVTYKSAWFMAHRIRYAMGQEPLSSKLQGIVEVDETYIGGKEKGRRGTPGSDSKKTPVVSMVERSLVKGKGKGKVRSTPVRSVTSNNLKPILRKYIASDAALNTDEAVVYYFAGKEFGSHNSVNHAAKQYVKFVDGVQKVTTNTVEGYFSILKRGITGVYQHVGRQHLHRYLSEFDFRYNARDVSDAERRDMAIAQVAGKRLMYRDSCVRSRG